MTIGQHTKHTNQRLLPHLVRSLLILPILWMLLIPLVYAQLPAPQEAGDPATPPSVTVAGTTATTILPETGQSILWIIGAGGIALAAGVLLFLRGKKAQ